MIKNQRIKLPKTGVNQNYSLSNRFYGADLMFLLKPNVSCQGEYVRHLNVRIGESPLMKKRAKPKAKNR